ncbi:AfsR/SARP family transcriptional regulator [Acrocarpospora macrocephala]|uniref:AfsR/SARP family transcriptional regulator n=1 Tax=Acrocarpospora macrocephala TaxID=150177 RepID=UPI0012D2BEF0|nr:AfsR/SARP family transcriptional regulator [Acrocarpospora macrocephala]
MNPLEFQLFGPFEVGRADGERLDLGPRKQRAVLALLALEPGRIVSMDRLIDELWADTVPSSAIGTLQAYISHLRRVLEPGRAPRTPPAILLTREPGYLLAVEPEQIDLVRFTAGVEQGRQALSRKAYGEALDALDRALATWRGEPLAEFSAYGFAQPVIARMSELQASATEDRFEARLALGDTGSSIADLERLVEAHPYRERLWGLLAMALYRAGRQADALAALRRARARLAEDLGLEPGPELRRVEQAVFDQSVTLEAQPPPKAVTAGLIAREAQLRRIADRLAEAARGQGGVLLVAGEAGIGKTRLAQAAADAAGVRVVWGRCVEADAAPAFWPWLQALREVGERAADTVRRLTSGSGDPAADPDVALFDLHERVLGTLAAEPVMVVLDDLHSADAASLRLLRYAARELHRRPMLVLATLRPEPGREPEQLADTLAALAREPGTERLRLPPFSPRDVAAYLGGADPALAAALYRRTGGNPFYLGELLRLLDGERLDQVPETVRDVISRRVARLPEPTQDLLRTASVLGRDVRLDVLAAAAAIPAEDVMARLAPAVATGLLAETPDGFDYRFSHVLVCDALYAGLDRLAKARLHLRAGEALESTGGESAPLPVLAHHFALAARVGGAARAVSYAARAARQATAQLAFDEAVELWQQALAAYGPGDPAERGALLIELGRARRATGDVIGAHATLAEAIDLAAGIGDRTAMAEAAMVFGGVTVWNWRSYGTVDDRMVAVLEDLLAGELPAEQRAALLGTLSLELHYGPRRAEGERHAAAAVEIARQNGDVALRARTLNNYINAAWVPGGGRDRLAAAEEMIALPGLTRSAELVARIMRMTALLELAEVAEWHAELARCRRLTAEVHQPDLVAMVWLAESTRAAMAGEWAESERLTGEYGRLLSRTTMWGLEDCRLATLFTSRRARGQAGEMAAGLVATAELPVHAPMRPLAVLATIDAGDEAAARRLTGRWAGWQPSDWSTRFVTAGWGMVAARLGAPDPEVMYERLLPHADELVVMGSQVVCWGATHQILADLAAGLGDPGLARDHAERALAAHERLGLTALTTPRTYALGQALTQTRSPDPARFRSGRGIGDPSAG